MGGGGGGWVKGESSSKSRVLSSLPKVIQGGYRGEDRGCFK